jgi:hypothetical protein
MSSFKIMHFDLEFEKDFADDSHVLLELLDDRLKLSANYVSKIPNIPEDISSGWRDNIYDYEINIKRESFVSVEKFWNEEKEYWKIELEANGYPNTVGIYFKYSDKNKDVVYNALLEWVFNK